MNYNKFSVLTTPYLYLSWRYPVLYRTGRDDLLVRRKLRTLKLVSLADLEKVPPALTTRNYYNISSSEQFITLRQRDRDWNANSN